MDGWMELNAPQRTGEKGEDEQEEGEAEAEAEEEFLRIANER